LNRKRRSKEARSNTHQDTLLCIRSDVLICLVLTIVTLAVYWQVTNHEFIGFDDPVYVTANRHIQTGLTLESISWSFTSTHAANWHPLTWLSHALDVQIYGTKPGGHHLTNVLFHMANSLLLFFVLRRMTGALWKSAIVAALFALHPLHVESVAWVAERKDVLSSFFWMLAMWSYVRYVESPGVKRYLLLAFFFALGLMAKPMLVTLPFVFLLLDYWPLKRLSQGKSFDKRLVLEKIPLFAFAAASCVATFFAQYSGGAVSSLTGIPFSIRVANALVSYAAYIGKMIWPYQLAVLYPFPVTVPWWQTTGAGLLLLSGFLLAIRAVKQQPYFVVGWLWYIGTLVPVIGLVQVGSQAMADRYTYIPLIGLFIIIVWGLPQLLKKWRYSQTVLAITAAVILSTFTTVTQYQLQYWENDTTLFKRTLQITNNNYLTHYNLGISLGKIGRTEEAIYHFSEALRINPSYANAHNNLGVALTDLGRTEKAIWHYFEALRLKPDFAGAHYNLGATLVNVGRTEGAITHFSEAIRIRPNFVEAQSALKTALLIQKRNMYNNK